MKDRLRPPRVEHRQEQLNGAFASATISDNRRMSAAEERVGTG
jgi:hypothetical protein